MSERDRILASAKRLGVKWGETADRVDVRAALESELGTGLQNLALIARIMARIFGKGQE